ncbi:ABC transporter ATP-binding protein [Desulfosediminicola ganghwensis]|uniref:ABC transporter ATP-binding protein n=1 Tax=Desulfosediminicola ganghwensis TaxID=2569540 RepID=UPI0010AC8BA4|nr:ABC transporter ATP-binding protein [Desulfosediminicola ganghwensis]
MKTSKLLEVTSLNSRYGDENVLQGVSFTLEKGEVLCLLGPSGSGKTTLLRILAGLEREESGTILYNGKDLQPIASHKRQIGMMFQEYALFPHKTVWQNIAFGLEMQKLEHERVQEKVKAMLVLVGLSGFENRRIDQLSGGERQRVALARCLAPEPELLLLDEPLGSLDRTLRDRLTAEIRAILKSIGVTAVFVTHDQAEAFSVADKVAILKDGILQQYDSPENVYKTPANKVVAEFLGFKNLIRLSGRDRSVPEGPFWQLVDHSIFEPDSSYLVLIRPDGAKVLENQEQVPRGWPCISGLVTLSRFQGASYRLEVRIGEELLRFELPLDPAPPPEGALIKLAINPSAVKLLPSE